MNIFRVEFRKISRGLIVWMLILCGLIMMYLAFYTSVKDLFLEKMDMLPDFFWGALRLEDFASMAGFTNYYATIFSFMLLAASCYACITGTGLFSREEGDKTIEFLNARPITRSKIVTAKLAASAFAMLLLAGAMVAVSFIGSAIFLDGAEYIQALTAMSLLCFIPVLLFLCLGMLLSTFVKPNLSTPIALGLFFTTYLLGAIAAMVEPLKFLKWLSPLDYLNPNNVIGMKIAGGVAKFDYTGLFLSLTIIVGCITATYIIYRKKDLAV